MYRYDPIDQRIVDERVAQYRDQTRRFLAGELTEDEFRPLRLQNGLYVQKYAPMLRVAVPYGLLSSKQLRALAAIARSARDEPLGESAPPRGRVVSIATRDSSCLKGMYVCRHPFSTRPAVPCRQSSRVC